MFHILMQQIKHIITAKKGLIVFHLYFITIKIPIISSKYIQIPKSIFETFEDRERSLLSIESNDTCTFL